jgi:hypothetical protein
MEISEKYQNTKSIKTFLCLVGYYSYIIAVKLWGSSYRVSPLSPPQTQNTGQSNSNNIPPFRKQTAAASSVVSQTAPLSSFLTERYNLKPWAMVNLKKLMNGSVKHIRTVATWCNIRSVRGRCCAVINSPSNCCFNMERALFTIF